MTTATGATAYDKKLGMPAGPPFVLAIGGACIQLSTLAYTWSAHTSAGPCMAAPLHCLSNLGDADVWGRQVVLTGLMILVVWVVSVISGIRDGKGWSDPSIVDRLWSIQPVLYLWHFALSAGSSSSSSSSSSSPRGLLMAALVTAWGGRLTYNFTIKGGFSGAEDYRWAVVRGWWGAPSLKWEAFNLIFVVAFQQATILAFSAPPALALADGARPFGTLDVVAGVLVALLILGETVADRQMFMFQTEKYRRKNAGEKLGPEYERGFIETGLWSLTRHPNYFCEVRARTMEGGGGKLGCVVSARACV